MNVATDRTPETPLSVTGGWPVVCPDLFGLRHLGAADTLRGRFVRAFAWALDRVWPPGKP